MCKVETPDGSEDMEEHGLEEDLVQHLGPRRFHPGAEAGGQDESGNIFSGHEITLFLIFTACSGPISHP
jgi:hypothetical protein